MYQKNVFLFQIQKMERRAVDIQHNICTSHLGKSFRLPTTLTFPGGYKTWTPGLVTQHDPSLIHLILVTGGGTHEARAAMGLNSRGNQVSGQSLKHQSVCVSICPWLHPTVSVWKGSLQQLALGVANKSEGKYLGNARKEWECELTNPSQTGGFFSPFTFILYKSPKWLGFRAGFKERVNFREVTSCFL